MYPNLYSKYSEIGRAACPRPRCAGSRPARLSPFDATVQKTTKRVRYIHVYLQIFPTCILSIVRLGVPHVPGRDVWAAGQ